MKFPDEIQEGVVNQDDYILVGTTGQNTPKKIRIGSLLLGSGTGEGGDGLSAYQIWLLQPGNSGKTVEEFIAWMQQPSVQAASLADHATIAANEAATLANQKATLANTKATEAGQAALAATEAAAAVIEVIEESELAIAAANQAAIEANAAKDNLNNVQLPLKAAHGYPVPEVPKTLKEVEDGLMTVIEEGLQNAGNQGVVDVQEDGFFIVDAAGKVMCKITQEGLDAAKIGTSLAAIIQQIAPTQQASTGGIQSISISGPSIVDIQYGPQEKSFSNTIVSDNPFENVLWLCDNGTIITQSNKSCYIEFSNVGLARVRCVSLSNGMISATWNVNVVDSSVIEQIELNYIFDNQVPGSAGGIIIARSNTSRNYNLAWADDDGIMTEFDVLEGDDVSFDISPSTPIFSLTAGVERSLVIPKKTMIPEGATRICVIGTTNTFFNIDPSKWYNQNFLGPIRLKVGLISDSHVDQADNYTSISNDLTKAWAWFQAEGVQFLTTSGDFTLDGASTEYQAFFDFWAGKLPVHTCSGNHDISKGTNMTDWFNRTGLPYSYTLSKGNPANNFISADKGTGQLYREDIPEDLVFVFVGMAQEYANTAIQTKDRLWLEGILPTLTNKRVLLYLHVNITGTSGDFNNVYPFIGPDKDFYQWFRPILEANPNIIHLHGHSHFSSHLALVENDLMYYEDSPTSFKSLHVPSLGKAKSIDGGGPGYQYEGEAMLIEIYDKYMVTKGYDVQENTLKPMAFQLIKFNN